MVGRIRDKFGDWCVWCAALLAAVVPNRSSPLRQARSSLIVDCSVHGGCSTKLRPRHDSVRGLHITSRTAHHQPRRWTMNITSMLTIYAVVPSHVGIDYSCLSLNARGLRPWRQTLVRRERHSVQCRQVRSHDDLNSGSTSCCVNSQQGRSRWRQLNVIVKTEIARCDTRFQAGVRRPRRSGVQDAQLSHLITFAQWKQAAECNAFFPVTLKLPLSKLVSTYVLWKW